MTVRPVARARVLAPGKPEGVDVDTRSLERKLTAILYADVAGYSRLTGEDEEGTHRTVSAYLDAITAQVEAHHGRVVHFAGDAVLADFGTTLDAVGCAVAVQHEIRSRNEELPADRRVWFRIGVNLGDVIVDRDDIYGDGVNIAARLEGLADPGGVCVSGTIHEALGSRLPLAFEYLGEQQVKNIANPVRAYRVVLEQPAAAGAVAPRREPGGASRFRLALVASGIAALAVVAWLATRSWQPQQPAPPATESVARPSVPPAQSPSPPAAPSTATDRPSVAVLPFANMSDDPEQDYFSDGLTEDIITDLARLSGLLVIARNSVFVYKGRAVNVQDVGRALGVRYVVEGSVRRAGNRVRITAQLIDATSGMHVWADRFDRELTDVFALQDEVTRTIVDALAINLTEEEAATLSRPRDTTPDAYDALLRGNELMARFSPQDVADARALYQQAIALNPRYARAYANIAFTHALEATFGWGADMEESIRLGFEAAEEARRLDDGIPQLHMALSNLHGARLQWEEAERAARRSLELEPSYADGAVQLAVSRTILGDLDGATQAIERAKRLNPHYSYIYIWVEARILYLRERYAEAAALLEEVLRRNPGFDQAHIMLAATYGQLGRLDDAQWEAEEVLAVQPDFTISGDIRVRGLRDPVLEARYREGLRKAGLPP